jgi:hypothetical protein
MADTRIQQKVERWIVDNELPRLYGEPFAKRSVRFSWGGSFEFDAVSADGRMIVCVSTSACQTASGRNAIGKFHKIKADTLYLLNAIGAERLVLLFTDPGMLAHFERERSRGRFPPATAIELRAIALPQVLADELRSASKIASLEVSPGR